ncbi:hypothetical protein [Burkholderia sp. Bp9012]|uniref:hypothetical protein n=1 Tax=Burkholderia sp. Bp9012 TaxID=2184562 RepID=UPI000F590B96|nr:hypothetical protein [Burkholderia sp. Bp9012]
MAFYIFSIMRRFVPAVPGVDIRQKPADSMCVRDAIVQFSGSPAESCPMPFYLNALEQSIYPLLKTFRLNTVDRNRLRDD